MPCLVFTASNYFSSINRRFYFGRRSSYRENFMNNCKKAIFFGSSADQTVVPWQSSLFGFFNGEGRMQDFKYR
jgi:hypothetical protein